MTALAVCFSSPTALAGANKAVTRPLNVIEGHLTITVDPATGAYHFTDWGWASEIGQYINTGSAGPGGLDLVTGEFLSGSGDVTAANVDTLDWTVRPTPNVVSYTGGTGRFQGVTGGFLAVVTSQRLLSNNSDGTLTFAITYDGKGTITY